MSRLTDEQLKAAYNAPNRGHLSSLRAVEDAAVAAYVAEMGEPVGGAGPLASEYDSWRCDECKGECKAVWQVCDACSGAGGGHVCHKELTL